MTQKNKTNAFVKAAKFRAYSVTENGATALATTGSILVDQFGKAGNFRGRPIDAVFYDMDKLWEENPQSALRFPFYLRLITRKTRIDKGVKTEKVQKGQGARDEAFKRLLWLARFHKDEFARNIAILPIVGSWKDMWSLLYYDITEGTHAIDENLIFSLLKLGLENELHVDLVKKFMPRIKSSSKCNTEWTLNMNMLAKRFAKYLRVPYTKYNKLKASGTAHDFQKLICNGKYEELDWNKIPGRALSLLASGNFLKRHNLVNSYQDWIDKQDVAPFVGYPCELYKRFRNMSSLSYTLSKTIDKQFDGLVKKAEADGKVTENVLVGLDTSGSMMTHIKGLPNYYCLDMAVSLALFFAKLNKGAFHNKVMMFDNVSTPFDLPSESFTTNVKALPHVGCGGTNFQSIIDELVKIRVQNPQIPLEEYPKTILVVSDMQFNPISRNWGWTSIPITEKATNAEYSRNKLKEVFPSEFVDSMKFVWWDCAGRGTNTYEGESDNGQDFFFSGFDGSILTFLIGAEEKENTTQSPKLTAEDVALNALNQEILSYVN